MLYLMVTSLFGCEAVCELVSGRHRVHSRGTEPYHDHHHYHHLLLFMLKRTIFATQSLVLEPFIIASQVLQVPSWQSYLTGMPEPRATSRIRCPPMARACASNRVGGHVRAVG